MFWREYECHAEDAKHIALDRGANGRTCGNNEDRKIKVCYLKGRKR